MSVGHLLHNRGDLVVPSIERFILSRLEERVLESTLEDATVERHVTDEGEHGTHLSTNVDRTLPVLPVWDSRERIELIELVNDAYPNESERPGWANDILNQLTASADADQVVFNPDGEGSRIVDVLQSHLQRVRMELESDGFHPSHVSEIGRFDIYCGNRPDAMPTLETPVSIRVTADSVEIASNQMLRELLDVAGEVCRKWGHGNLDASLRQLSDVLVTVRGGFTSDDRIDGLLEQRVDRLVAAIIEDPRVDAHEIQTKLDGQVRHVAETLANRRASSINSEGNRRQIQFLLENGYTDAEVLRLIRQAAAA